MIKIKGRLYKYVYIIASFGIVLMEVYIGSGIGPPSPSLPVSWCQKVVGTEKVELVGPLNHLA